MNTTGQKNDKDNKEKRYSSFSITHLLDKKLKLYNLSVNSINNKFVSISSFGGKKFMPASSILKSCYVSSHFKLDRLVHDENVKAHTQTDV